MGIPGQFKLCASPDCCRWVKRGRGVGGVRHSDYCEYHGRYDSKPPNPEIKLSISAVRRHLPVATAIGIPYPETTSSAPYGICQASGCGNLLLAPRPPGNHPKKWCSRKCAQRERARRQAGNQSGTTIITASGRPYLVSDRLRWQRTERVAPCMSCGTLTITKGSGKVKCSDCRRSADRVLNQQYQVRRRKSFPPRNCDGCGIEFLPIRDGHRYCTSACKRHDRPRHHREKAMAWGLEYDPTVTRIAVMTRDAWTCGLCGGKINKGTAHPQHDAGTIDHILPMSLSGGHTWDNVRAAHSACNVKRGNRMDTGIVYLRIEPNPALSQVRRPNPS